MPARRAGRGFCGARLDGACFRIRGALNADFAGRCAAWKDCFRLPARRAGRGFCRGMRGLAGLPPNVCAASWTRFLPDDARFDGVCFRKLARRTERGFYGARLDGACFRMPALQRARILRGASGWSLLPSACVSASVVLSGRGLEGLFLYVCASASAAFAGARLGGACFRLPA